MVQKLRGIVRLHNVLILHPGLRSNYVACVLHFPSNGFLSGAAGSTAAQGRLVHINRHLALELVHVHQSLISIIGKLILVSNIIHVTNAIVMVMLDVLTIGPFRLLLRLLILSL